ncbi:MAG: type I-C CRISPR-associated protein Cas8c/Csd1 [Betaproteobacteria bacterium HGW-Betaproteobacteria-14]|nr:MAG: type I-C CRISPR-associated protein Cas8c/Csd1 [Betaproteobacteria bacterium HGW-Betaproteobacteria-14]PKO91157.1 MAG: type I-C CRISPR-associated protein Cas8c/Csd1 [Betaproteobacteria bacterium HGW-Betaproteobacteria-10]
MAWIERLYQTYENCADKIEAVGLRLWPLSHTVKKAHVEIAIDAKGNFRRARKLNRLESPTLIPATEDSAGRTSGIAPHPLCEELSYCAADLPDADPERQKKYIELLHKWRDSAFTHPKIESVYAYVAKGSVWSDLNREKIFPVSTEDSRGNKAKVADDKVFLRWVVEGAQDPCSATWEDKSLIAAWMHFDAQQNDRTGFCMVTGQSTRIAQSHSRFVRRAGDGAKLISANDFSGYTFRGRFTDEKKDYEKQACSVSFEVSQKAHSALRWLIGRQSYHDFQSGQVFVAWAVAGKPIPDPFEDTLALILGSSKNVQPAGGADSGLAGDAGQFFALRLKQAIRGYRANLDPTDDIVVMGLDSATPGRMAITYYRELKGSEFLDRIEDWHTQYAWAQDFGKNTKFVGAPAPRDIAEAAFSTRIGETGELRVDDALRKATIERLLPCIIDGQPIPLDLVLSTARRASNRAPLKRWEWEKFLGIACALFRGYSKSQGKEYQMALEEDRGTRDYLYGRLLALADSIEGYALRLADEKRGTTAARLMQRFADRPFSTWRNIELALTPYKSRLRASEKGSGFLWKREKLLDEIQCCFLSDDFTSDRALSGEFLLGYHCQRAALQRGSEPAEDDVQPTTK